MRRPLLHFYPLISAAIAAASAGDSIFISSGTYPENLTIDKELKLWGTGSGATIISGSTGSPTITMQGSDDGEDGWFDYKEVLNIAIPESFIDDEFFPKYMRLVYTANSSDGLITFKFGKLLQ